MDEIEIIADLRNLRRDLKLTEQETSRKSHRVHLLNQCNYDFGEERIQLERLQPDLPSLRTQITEAISKVKKGKLTGDEAMHAYFEISSEIHSAQATLECIRVPKLNQVWAAERRNTY